MAEDNTTQADQFWSDSLTGFDAPTPLMIAQPSVSRAVHERATIPYATDRARGHAATGFWTAVWALLLGRYSNEDRVLFGHVVDGKVWPVVANMDWERPFAAWRAELSGWLDQASSLPWQSTEELQRRHTSIPGSEPLFESLIVPPGEAFPDALPPLAVYVGESGFAFRFDSRRFPTDAIERMAAHLETLADSVIGNPDVSLIEMRLLPDAEYEKVVFEWNATEVDFPSDKCLHHLFEEQVHIRPDAPAVTHDGVTLSYRELNERANRIAHRLLALGVERDTAVGVSLRRGTDVAAAFMGIAKAGAGYLPLDPEYPGDRLQFMVRDSAVSVLVTQSELEPLFAASRGEKLVIDAQDANLESESAANPEVDVAPEDLAYLIYTSGSTGMPKGVMVDHRGRVNNFCDFNRRFAVGPRDRVLGISSISFDMCAYDVFGTLAAGAELIVGESGSNVDPLAWSELMLAHRVTVWHSVPALLEMVVDEVESHADRHPRSLRLVLLGGDWIPVTLPDRVKAISAKSVQVISMGGATEVSMDSTIYEIGETDLRWKSIPYGAPMWNQRAYVLDRLMHPTPIGVPGELYLGGIGVGRGYYNRPDLNEEKFVPNPFLPGERLYRTGDLCRWRADGNLQILGRMDFQLKIRGFRIELGEIETALRAHPDVHEAVVMAKPGPGGEQRLVAYVVRNTEQALAPDSGAIANRTVDRWARAFDAAYSVPAGQEGDPTFRIASWNSSYTGRPYDADVMGEWVRTSVDRILALAPRRVFEIGCGTGLLLFRIAPHCEAYVGIDPSGVAVEHVRTHAGRLGLDNVRVERQDAASLDAYQQGGFDTVVINSVAQNFPDAEYFHRVVENAIGLLQPGGVIFFGDVRDKLTERELQASVALHRAPGKWSGEEVLESAGRQMDRQEELIIDPRAFAALKNRFPEIRHVEVELRRGGYDDEMTKFRYNAVLTVGEDVDVPGVDETIEYRPGVLDGILRSSTARLLEIRSIPNSRIKPESDLLSFMEQQGRQLSRDELLAYLNARRRDAGLLSPDDLERRVGDFGFRTVCRYARSNDRGFFDALLYRGGRLPRHLPCEFPDMQEDGNGYFNQPVNDSLQLELTPELRRHLEESLPHYMIPTAFVYLEAFPLSPNGKVNRRALPDPDNVRPELNVPFVPPAGPLEELLAGLWTDALGIDRLGVLDPFVAVGGSSLLAVQLVSKTRQIFRVQLPIKACLNGNLRDFKEALSAGGASSGIDVEEIADVYAQVRTMSDREAETRLEEHPQ